MGFDYPFYHEPAKIPADHFQDCDQQNQKFRAQKLPGLNVKGLKLAKSKLFYGFYHALKSYHEIHDDKEEILGDEILDLYDSYNLQNSYDF